MQEYREKYDSYCSLNKTLENYRYHIVLLLMFNALGFPPLNWMCWSHFLLVKTVWFFCCRNEFHKLGRDLENAKGKDMEKYHSILGQLRESYRQCGTVSFILVVSCKVSYTSGFT